MLCRSLFRKALPGKPVASADAHTATGNALLTVLHAASVAIWITLLSNVEALGGGTVQLVTHPPREGHRIDRDGSAVTSQTKAGDVEEAVASRNLLPKDQAAVVAVEEASPFKTNALMVTGLPRPQHPPKVDGLEGNKTKESVSMKTGLLRPPHPPKVSGEQFINTFSCDALTSSGNELYVPPPQPREGLTPTQTVMARQK